MDVTVSVTNLACVLRPPGHIQMLQAHTGVDRGDPHTGQEVRADGLHCGGLHVPRSHLLHPGRQQGGHTDFNVHWRTKRLTSQELKYKMMASNLTKTLDLHS